MISKEEIQKLADLARIEIGGKEAAKLAGEMDAILGYVKLVQQFHSEGTPEELGIEIGENYNVLREDENPTESGTYSKELITEFPEKEGDYLKAKKIL